MAIKRNVPVQDFDQAVAAVMDGADDPVYAEKRSRARGMTASQRRKAAKDKARNRMMIDLPVALERMVDSLAAELGVPVSQVANYLMIRGLQCARLGELAAAKRVTRSMRYEYTLELPDVPGKLEK